MHTAILAGCAPHHVTRCGTGPAHFPRPPRLRPRLSLPWLRPAPQVRPWSRPFPVRPSPLFLSLRRPRPHLFPLFPGPCPSSHSAARARPTVQKEPCGLGTGSGLPSGSLVCYGGLYHSDQGPAAAAATECSRTLDRRCSAAPQHRATAHGRCKWGRATGGTRKTQGSHTADEPLFTQAGTRVSHLSLFPQWG